tara:strand:+ start:825 stop:1046 length:222 start_codon:yes stop_codon:yes gene_type:complete
MRKLLLRDKLSFEKEPLIRVIKKMCWAICAIHRFLFTVALCSTITAKSGFKKAGCSLLSSLTRRFQDSFIISE